MKLNLKNAAILLLSCLLFLTGCSQDKNSHKYILDNDDKIVLTVKSNGGYSLKPNGANYQVLKDNDTVLTGTFVSKDVLNNFLKNVNDENNKDVLYKEEGKVSTSEYVYYETMGENGMEYNFVVTIMYSNSGAILGSTVSREAALEAIDQLIFRVELREL